MRQRVGHQTLCFAGFQFLGHLAQGPSDIAQGLGPPAGGVGRLDLLQRLTDVVPDDLPPVVLDAVRIRRVLANLLSNAIKFTTGGPGAADAHSEPSEPLRLLLGQSEPNPMSRGTTIRFQLDRQRPVTLRIYDVDGHLVRTLRDGSTAAGQHSVPWTGLDDRGLQVPSGVYFYKRDAEDQSLEKKLMLIR